MLHVLQSGLVSVSLAFDLIFVLAALVLYKIPASYGSVDGPFEFSDLTLLYTFLKS